MQIPIVGGDNGGMSSTRYRAIILETLTQLNTTNGMIQQVKKQANENEANGEIEKYQENERLVMHLDTKACMLMNIIATYEVAFQMAVTNEKMQALAAASAVSRLRTN